MSACSSCGAPVRYVRSNATGKWMIIDPEPTEEGNIILLGDRAVAHPTPAAAVKAYGRMPRYLDHHVTCPEGKAWSAYTAGKGPKPEQLKLGGES